MDDHAFVGISLDSKLFSREWIQMAVRCILDRNATVEFVLCDRLLSFNKTLSQESGGKVTMDLSECEARIAKRSGDIHGLMVSEVSVLSESDRCRVSVSKWGDHADSRFADIHRVLSIAYASLDQFRECVDRDVEAHLLHQTKTLVSSAIHRSLCALYIIEESAMSIRITEFGRPFEYYPGTPICTLSDIYDGRFAPYGLTVEAIVGHPPKRLFQPLTLQSNCAGLVD